MVKLRYYQREGIDALKDHWNNGGSSGVVEVATGGGKSLMIGTTTKEIIDENREARVLLLTHVKELVRQNVEAILRVWPTCPIGINSAGLYRRDKRSKVLYASIQSVARETPFSLGDFTHIFVDEAHMVPQDGSGQYLTLFSRFHKSNNNLLIGGFTATPYRLDSGRIDEGENALFDKTVYQYDIGRGVDDGFLSPLVSRPTESVLDVSGIKRAKGEFVARALEDAVNLDPLVRAATAEMVTQGESRRSWLAFCAGVDHAFCVRDALYRLGITCATVTGDTPSGERDRIFRDFKAGKIRCLTGVNVFSTGFDAPNVDMLAFLRPTLSTGLYVQQAGRGTRLFDGKENCRVLDFALNVRRHGPVDSINVSSERTGKTTVDSVKTKECLNEECGASNFIQARECKYCGHPFPFEERGLQHKDKPDSEAPILSREIQDTWINVDYVQAFPHFKGDDPPSMRIEYVTGLSTYNQWVLLEAGFQQGARAQRFWRIVVGTPVPDKTADGCARLPNELNALAVQVARNGKHWNITKMRVKRKDGRIIDIDAHTLSSRPANILAVA